MTICQGVEKMSTLYHMFYNKKKASTIQTFLDRIFFKKRQNTVFLNVSNVLSYSVLSKYWLLLPHFISVNVYKQSSRGYPDGLAGKESACNAGDTGGSGSIPGSNPFQYFCLKNPMDIEAWWANQSKVSQRAGHDLVAKQQQRVLRF